MNFELNNNGNTARDLREQFDTMHGMVVALDNHMATMDWHHDRNYQTTEHPLGMRETDLAEWTAIRDDVRRARNFALSALARLIRQREGL